MILNLAVRFRKHIAALLLCSFSVQFTMAECAGIYNGEMVRSNRWSATGIYPWGNAALWKWLSERGYADIKPWKAIAGVGSNTVVTGRSPVYSISALHEKQVADEQPFIGGPGQPEMSSFQSVNGNNMVDLFSGDFSYNIPLLDVGGYPVNIAYKSGVTMDDEASWVGLGWNINPGSITRNMRGVPDDFNGGTDTITKVSHIKDNVNLGVNVGADVELSGLPLSLGLGLGIFHNTYNGWGIESSFNASLNAGEKNGGGLTGGLSITNNSQNGVTINPSLSYRLGRHDIGDKSHGNQAGFSISSSYNTRSGLRDLQLGVNASHYKKQKTEGKADSYSSDGGSSAGFTVLSFGSPTYTPSITMPMTNYNFSFTAKIGGEATVVHPNFSVTGYGGKEYIAAADTSLSLPVFGYLNYQNMGNNWSALTDFNREKEMPYREKPAIPHIAIPSYTYDVFSMSGEGTGGVFRAYRGDVGFVADHYSKSKTISGAASIDLGAGNLAHGGVDLNANYAVVQTGPWQSENTLQKNISFRNNQGLYEAVYFRNPGEKTINTTAFYDSIGGDDVVAPVLYQADNSPTIIATNMLTRFRGKKDVGTLKLNAAGAMRATRDKRAQVISYLTAKEASEVGLNKHIERYELNKFGLGECESFATEDGAGKGTGLIGYYYKNKTVSGSPYYTRLDRVLFFNWDRGSPFFNINVPNATIIDVDRSFPTDNFSARWVGRIKAPETGTYTIGLFSDDGVRMWVNDSVVISNWGEHGGIWDTTSLNLVQGQMYNIRVEYYEETGRAKCFLAWRKPSQLYKALNEKDTLATEYLYPPKFSDFTTIDSIRTHEDRVNKFRKSSHISEIDVLNPDGRRYIYGIPVYNLLQKEVSFSVDGDHNGNRQTGLTSFFYGKDNTTKNTEGKDGYFSKEEIPAYAHSFLLTGLLSPDYVDITGDGISDDDIGDAVKFNYTKTSGIDNPFEWRAPYITDSANFNEGLRTYNRDDKAHYIYGKKEMWYLHSIESKTMIANFTLAPREDMLEINEKGAKASKGKAYCLKKIDLYSKADFIAHGNKATPVKTVHFEYTYELCRGINRPVNDSGKLTLKRIWFSYNGNNKGQQNPYVFHYHQNNPVYRTNFVDRWGTYKNPAQNPGATNNNLIGNAEYPYALQDSTIAAYNAGAWTLDSIKLPSGGRIKVKYESDDYGYVQNKRAAQLFKLAGFGISSGSYDSKLYASDGEHLYAYVKVPYPVSTKQELYARYLNGIDTLFFRLSVKMPSDAFGSGTEYVSCYAVPDMQVGQWYGIKDANTIWIKIKGVNKDGTDGGVLSPLAQTAISFLRLNLPSKAYPGSEVSDNMDFIDGVKIVMSQISNVVVLLNGYSNTARAMNWGSTTDTSRSFVRLNNPQLKKYGGGLRVKSILIYDNWNAMTGKKEALYGQTYDYTTKEIVNGKETRISSGVAAWEPGIGGEENPFHLPIEYVERASVMAPAATLYTETPLGESFFPAAAVGYSKVRVISLRREKARSGNGYTETAFFTTKDFPTIWDWSVIDGSSKKRYKPLLSNFLRINARNYLAVSQGFKVELNDMNGKMRSEAIYSESDSVGMISYTENFYKVDDQKTAVKHLNNIVTTIDPLGNIDTAATIGKDVELMTDMRDHSSTSIGGNLNIDVDLFAAGVWPVAIPALLSLYQQSTNRFRSAAMTKVIYRFGIIDSVIHIEKGSKISTRNILYDSETGDPLLTRTQNEFNDSIYQFSYPAHWVYDGMGPAYKNIGATLKGLTISAGKITGGLPHPDTVYFTAGDELLVYSKQTINVTSCVNKYATFPVSYKLWVTDTNTIHGGAQKLYLVDESGTPFSGNDVTIKIIRSGRRNMGGSVGSIASLASPLVKDGSGKYKLVFDATTRVINAGAAEIQQAWKVADKKRSDIFKNCIATPEDSARAAAQSCACLKPFFDYLIASGNLFIQKSQRRTVGSLVNQAIAAGYPININSCSILSDNATLPFYALSSGTNTPIYMAMVGNNVINLRSRSGWAMSWYNLNKSYCTNGAVIYKDTTITVPAPDTLTVDIIPDFSVNLLSASGDCPTFTDTLLVTDSVSDRLMIENNLNVDGRNRNAVSILRFKNIDQIPEGAEILKGDLLLYADQRGHTPQWTNANSVNPEDSLGVALTAPAGWFPYQPLDTMLFQGYFSSWFSGAKKLTPFQNDTIDVMSYVNAYKAGLYASNTFILTQGSHNLTGTWPVDTASVPGYLQSGYGNYYSTYYSQRYTDQAKWPKIRVKYVAPLITPDTLGAILEFNATVSCTTIIGRTCYSSVTDTTVNPYVYGILGNYRPLRSYVYYGERKESDPIQPTNIRKDGTIKDFAPFWTLQQNKWQPSTDTSRWVWNSVTTMFNRKGFELENKDPLGRYNAGLYGYGLTLPVAVVQNSRYQEAAFEGFEDYGFVAKDCDTFCSVARTFDFAPYKNQFSTQYAHSGLRSLRIGKDSTISMAIPVMQAAAIKDLQLSTATVSDACLGTKLKGTLATTGTLLPSFAPLAGKKMVIGAWVKEDTACMCRTYTGNHILVTFSNGGGNTTIALRPSGNIVEGWQRYEAIVTIPGDITLMTVTLQASADNVTYFDDIRIHPYNAQMKSYSYNPVNLRLMAELDENNYATYYEYDDDGTLIRLKKETERGIQTIKETRSALLK